MKKIPLLLIILLTLTSCSMPVSKTDNGLHFFPDESSQLKNIVIYSFGVQRFTGLLGLIKKQDGLYYFLLDATGIKLLEVEVAADGAYIVKNGLKRLKEGSLPRILANSLLKMFHIEPAQHPCSTHFLQKLCREPLGEGTWIKYARTGFIPHWRVYYSMDTDPHIIYTQPWIGLKITLAEIKQ